MNDWAPHFREKYSRRCTDTNSCWAFACGVIWTLTIVIMLEAVL
jgi:hypothetical protein